MDEIIQKNIDESVDRALVVIQKYGRIDADIMSEIRKELEDKYKKIWKEEMIKSGRLLEANLAKQLVSLANNPESKCLNENDWSKIGNSIQNILEKWN